MCDSRVVLEKIVHSWCPLGKLTLLESSTGAKLLASFGCVTRRNQDIVKKVYATNTRP